MSTFAIRSVAAVPRATAASDEPRRTRVRASASSRSDDAGLIPTTAARPRSPSKIRPARLGHHAGGLRSDGSDGWHKRAVPLLAEEAAAVPLKKEKDVLSMGEAMDAFATVAAEHEAQRAMARQALRASDARLAAIMAKHDKPENKNIKAAVRRGSQTTVHAMSPASEDTAEATKLKNDLAAAEKKIENAEAFAETLAKDMGAAVQEAERAKTEVKKMKKELEAAKKETEAAKKETEEVKERLAAAVDERADKVSELLKEIDHWADVASRAQASEKEATAELEKARAEAKVELKITVKDDEEEAKKGAEAEKEARAAMEAKDEELGRLRMELEEAKKAAAAVDKEMHELRRSNEEGAAAKRALEESKKTTANAAEKASKAVADAEENLRVAEKRVDGLKASVKERDDELSALRAKLAEQKEIANQSVADAVEASKKLHEMELQAEEARLAAAAAALCIAREVVTKVKL